MWLNDHVALAHQGLAGWCHCGALTYKMQSATGTLHLSTYRYDRLRTSCRHAQSPCSAQADGSACSETHNECLKHACSEIRTCAPVLTLRVSPSRHAKVETATSARCVWSRCKVQSLAQTASRPRHVAKVRTCVHVLGALLQA